jgi:hypothetical protein
LATRNYEKQVIKNTIMANSTKSMEINFNTTQTLFEALNSLNGRRRVSFQKL